MKDWMKKSAIAAALVFGIAAVAATVAVTGHGTAEAHPGDPQPEPVHVQVEKNQPVIIEYVASAVASAENCGEVSVETAVQAYSHIYDGPQGNALVDSSSDSVSDSDSAEFCVRVDAGMTKRGQAVIVLR